MRRHLIEALWVHQQHRRPDDVATDTQLDSPVADARAAAVRVIRDAARDVAYRTLADSVGGNYRRSRCFSYHAAHPPRMLRPEIPSIERRVYREDRLLRLASDPSPQVRAEVVVAATYTRGTLAPEIIFAAMQTEQDPQLSYVINEARGIINLDQAIRETLASGKKLSTQRRSLRTLQRQCRRSAEDGKNRRRLSSHPDSRKCARRNAADVADRTRETSQRCRRLKNSSR